MCIWSIELIWVSTYGKMEEKHILGIFRDLYRYTFGPVLVQLSRTEPVPVQVKVVPVQVVFCFSVLTSVCIFTITCSFLIRFE